MLVEVVSVKESLSDVSTATSIAKRLSQLYQSLQAFVKGTGGCSFK